MSDYLVTSALEKLEKLEELAPPPQEELLSYNFTKILIQILFLPPLLA
ncbi:MAG: hypothetical protein F6K58_25880 [Symploca sp. SIO2E9]|nr:hypothetical protein [Symploca sp. SIO2E9]